MSAESNPDTQKGTVRKTISLPADMDLEAVRRADEERRSYSNYLAWLIEQDVRRTAGQAAVPV